MVLIKIFAYNIGLILKEMNTSFILALAQIANAVCHLAYCICSLGKGQDKTNF